LNEECKAWKQWLTNEDIPRDVRLSALKDQDEKEWTPLHYASRFYRPDILDIAKELENSDQTGMQHFLLCELDNCAVYPYALSVFSAY